MRYVSRFHEKTKRSKVAKDTDCGRTYKIVITTIDRYWDEGYYPVNRKYNRASKRSGKDIYQFQVRMYKTWKYNRKKQYK